MITNGTQQYNNNGNGSYVNLAMLGGSGESTMFVTDVQGVLLGIEVRDGFYTITDRKTGQPIQRPNSWVAHWMTNQGEKLMSWPTYQDTATGEVKPWSRFDPSINLARRLTRKGQGYRKVALPLLLCDCLDYFFHQTQQGRHSCSCSESTL